MSEHVTVILRKFSLFDETEMHFDSTAGNFRAEIDQGAAQKLQFFPGMAFAGPF